VRRQPKSSLYEVLTVLLLPVSQKQTLPTYAANSIHILLPISWMTGNLRRTKTVCFCHLLPYLYLTQCASDEEHARAMEEQWIDSMDTVGSASLSQGSSSNTALMQGTFIGFFFPILPLFFLRKPSTSAFWDDNTEVEAPESVIFS